MPLTQLFAEAGDIVGAFLSDDAWAISEAMGADGVWLLGLAVTLVGGALVLALYRLVPFIDRHLERTVMVWSYLVIAGIIFVEVFRRFVLSEQAAWSTTLPPYLFLIMTWFGCAYNVRLRTHLAFAEIRMSLPRGGQLFCSLLDAALWLGLCWVVIVTSGRVAANSAANFQILLGTDNVLQWWLLSSVPAAFLLMAARVLENLLDDIARYRAGVAVLKPAMIGGE